MMSIAIAYSAPVQPNDSTYWGTPHVTTTLLPQNTAIVRARQKRSLPLLRNWGLPTTLKKHRISQKKIRDHSSQFSMPVYSKAIPPEQRSLPIDFIHNTFFETDNWIIENIDAIRHIPCVIVQGRYDICCPMESAWELHRA